MKKKLTVIISVLLVLCVLAAAVKIGHNDRSDENLIVNPGQVVNAVGYSWVDPYTGIDIFVYNNLFSFEEGATSYIYSGDVYDTDGVVLHADESVDIPSAIGDVSIDSTTTYCCMLPGTYAVKPGYTYYAYYARELDGTWCRMGLNGMTVREPGTESELPYELGLATSYIDVGDESTDNHIEPDSGGSFTVNVEGTCILGVQYGCKNSEVYANTGTVYVRLIAVPN